MIKREIYEKTNAFLTAVNNDLFASMRTIITGLEQENYREDDYILIRVASVCGVGKIELDGSIVISEEFFDRLKSIVINRTQGYLDDVNFGNFSKAELFESINQRIAIPIRC